jgi:hypothetical protein
MSRTGAAAWADGAERRRKDTMPPFFVNRDNDEFRFR